MDLLVEMNKIDKMVKRDKDKINVLNEMDRLSKMNVFNEFEILSQINSPSIIDLIIENIRKKTTTSCIKQNNGTNNDINNDINENQDNNSILNLEKIKQILNIEDKLKVKHNELDNVKKKNKYVDYNTKNSSPNIVININNNSEKKPELEKKQSFKEEKDFKEGEKGLEKKITSLQSETPLQSEIQLQSETPLQNKSPLQNISSLPNKPLQNKSPLQNISSLQNIGNLPINEVIPLPTNKNPLLNSLLNQSIPAQPTINQIPKPTINQIPKPTINQIPKPSINQSPINQIPINQTPKPTINQTPKPTINQIPINQSPINQIPINQSPTNQVPINQSPINKIPINQSPINKVPINQTPKPTINQTPIKQNSNFPFFSNFSQGSNQDFSPNQFNPQSSNNQSSNSQTQYPNYSSQYPTQYPNFNSLGYNNQNPSKDFFDFGSSSKQINPSLGQINPSLKQINPSPNQREFNQGQKGQILGPDFVRSNKFRENMSNENMSSAKRYDTQNARLKEIEDLQELNKEQRRTGINKIGNIQDNQNLNNLKQEYLADQQLWNKEQYKLIGVLEQIHAYQQSLVSDNEKNGIEIEEVIGEQGKILNLINEINNKITLNSVK